MPAPSPDSSACAPKAVLVTGAARRLGRSIALALARQGWDVALHYHRSKAEASATQQEIQALGMACVCLQADLGQASACRALVQEAGAAFAHLQALVNSASMFELDRAGDADQNLWHKHMDINLRAPWLLSQALYAQLAQGVQACVVNLLDQKVFNLNPDFFSYTMSKIGLEGLTRVLAMEFAPRVRVCGVAPGLTMLSGEQSRPNFDKAHSMNPLGKSSDSQDVAQAVAYLLAAKAVTGSTLIVDGGQHLFPLKRDVMFEVDELKI